MESGAPFRVIDVSIKHDVPFVMIRGDAVAYHGYVPLKPIFSRTASGRRSSNRLCSERTRRIAAMSCSIRANRSEDVRSISDMRLRNAA